MKVSRKEDVIKSASIVVLDANVPLETIDFTVDLCSRHNVPGKKNFPNQRLTRINRQTALTSVFDVNNMEYHHGQNIYFLGKKRFTVSKIVVVRKEYSDIYIIDFRTRIPVAFCSFFAFSFSPSLSRSLVRTNLFTKSRQTVSTL